MSTQYISPRDTCGEGNGTAVQYSHGAHWQQFPVPFSIDVVGEYNFAVNQPVAVRDAVVNCFLYINELVGFEFFRLVDDATKAKVQFAFGPLEGTTLGRCSFNYSNSTKKMNRASIILDSTSRKWFVNPKVQCDPGGSYFDIASTTTHEIGHALGLGHNSGDNKATMYPSGATGQTFRRTFSKGERDLISKIYGKYKPTTEPPQPKPSPLESRVNYIYTYLTKKFPDFTT